MVFLLRRDSLSSRLCKASSDGDWFSAYVLLVNCDVDIEELGRDGRSPLLIAAVGGFDDVVELLLDHGADVFNVGNCAPATLLHWVAGSGLANGRGTGVTMRRLLKTFASTERVCCVDQRLYVNTQDALGQTPLHLAARTGTLDAVEQLLLFGADASRVDRNGETPMHVAASCEASSKCNLIFEHLTRAELCIQDNRGETVLHYAAGRAMFHPTDTRHPTHPRSSVFASRQNRVNMVTLFIEGGVDVSIQNSAGDTAEDLAVAMQRLYVVDLLKVLYPSLFGHLTGCGVLTPYCVLLVHHPTAFASLTRSFL